MLSTKMKLLDILQEAVTEYKVSYTVIKNKNVSKGSASYKDLADASKFFDSLTKDPEVYRAQIDKILGEDSSRDMGGARYMGGKEEIVSYSHPATKGVSQGGKKFDELTPAEQDIRTFANSRIDQQEKLGFTGDIGFSMNEERTSTISKKRASAELKQKIKGTRSDGMGKYTATIFGMDGDKRVKLKDMNDLNKYSKFEISESVKDKIDAQLMKLLDAVGFDKFADVLIDKFGVDGFTDRLHSAIERMPGGEKILQKIGDMSALKEGMSKEALYSQIRDIIDSLDSGESDGIPLDNETEMLLQQELRRLRKIYKSIK